MNSQIVERIRVGKGEVNPRLPNHVPGVREGNSTGRLRRAKGFHEEGPIVTATPYRSTGINAKARSPILPQMPRLSPP